MIEHHQKFLWAYWFIVFAGLWLIFCGLSTSYALNPVEPAGARQIWISLQSRIEVLKISDIVSGIALIIFGFRALSPDRPVSLWAACFTGIWLNFAPLLFWAPTAFIYLNDTLVGTLVITLSVLIPGMPNMVAFMQANPQQPGWSYNPSSWPQRAPMIALGFFGWMVSRYLAFYQLGYLDRVWDPLFGHGTKSVLDSSISRSLPISDAGLGAVAYTFEFLMGWMGSQARWRTMPWMVTFFGILVIPLGLVHILLVSSQPVVVGYWCTLCLLAAAIMLPMIPLEVDEVVAMLQFMVKARGEGKAFWRTFWLGDTLQGGTSQNNDLEITHFAKEPLATFRAGILGMSAPANLVITAAMGLYLMFSPAIFSKSGTSADFDHILGALIITVSVISMAEIIRTARFVNIIICVILVIAAIFTQSSGPTGKLSSIVCGFIIAVLSLPRGKILQHYGGWERYIF